MPTSVSTSLYALASRFAIYFQPATNDVKNQELPNLISSAAPDLLDKINPCITFHQVRKDSCSEAKGSRNSPRD